MDIPTSIRSNLLGESRDFIASTCFSVSFPIVFPIAEYANLAGSLICL